MPIFDNQQEDPVLYEETVWLARRPVGIVEPCLPGPEATQEALREFYLAIRFGLKDFERKMRQNGRAR
jgi:hypothetical protein